MERALAAYNAESGDAAPIAIDVNRHPFSFETDALEKGVLGSWQAVLRESGNAWHQDGKHTRLNAQVRSSTTVMPPPHPPSYACLSSAPA